MRSSCALSCDSCDDSVEISADGSVEGSAEGGAVAGIPVSFVHALGDVAELEITWLGDGRGEAESEVPIMTLHQMGERSTVTTFIGHVFAVNEKVTGRRISRVRMLPGRDIMTIDAAHAKMHDTNAADVKLCADRYDSCPQRARDGECERKQLPLLVCSIPLSSSHVSGLRVPAFAYAARVPWCSMLIPR